MKDKRFFHPAIFIILAIAIALSMLFFAFIEVNHSKLMIRELITEKGLAIVEQVEKGAALSLRASDQIEDELSLRLLSLARIVRQDDLNLDQEELLYLARTHACKTVHIIDEQGKIVLSNHEDEHFSGKKVPDFREIYPELFSGEEEEMVLGLHHPPHNQGYRFSVAVRRRSGGIIVASIDAETFLQFRRSFGIGRLIQDVGKLHGIVFLVIQDREGIIAATSNVVDMEAISNDPLLEGADSDGKVATRFALWQGGEIFEIVRRINLNENVSALLRVGFDSHEMKQLEGKAQRRLIMTFLAIFILLLISVNALLIYNNFLIMRRARDELATFSDSILREMADGVIVVDSNLKIKIINEAAKNYFRVDGSSLPDTLGPIAENVFKGQSPLIVPLLIAYSTMESRSLILSASKVMNDKTHESYAILVCHDETEKKKSERQLQQIEKTVAMGKLAGSVAHEIRNPLNAIGLAIQRLQSILPKSDDKDKSTRILAIVQEEIGRLNDIITQFLRFARTPAIELRNTDIVHLIENVLEEIDGIITQKEIIVALDLPDKCNIPLDRKQFYQVFLNLFLNSLESMDTGGKLTVELREGETQIEILIRDTGVGMDKNVLEKIFDLYFTTKNKGTGLGLPITLRVVQAHLGYLDFESTPIVGTSASIRLPKEHVT